MEIRLKNIKKNYGSFEALKGIDLVLEEGKFYGLLGPNGAGKTTLFNLLIQNFKQSSGDISWEVDGRPLSTKDFYRHIGIVFQSKAPCARAVLPCQKANSGIRIPLF